MGNRTDFVFVLLVTAALAAMLVLGLLLGGEEAGPAGPGARPPLPEAAEGPADFDAVHRGRLAEAEGKLAETARGEINAMVAGLGAEGDHTSRSALWDALVSRGEAAVPALVRVLGNGNLAARQAAAQLLGEVGLPLAVHDLARGLGDEAFEVQACCAEALGKIGDRSAVVDLLRWKVEPKRHPVARARIAAALAALGSRAGFPDLLSALYGKVFVIRIALEALRRHTGKNFGMDAYALRTERESRANLWKTWWAGAKKGFAPQATSPDRTDPGRLAWIVRREIRVPEKNRYYYMLQSKKVLRLLGEPAGPYVCRALYYGLPAGPTDASFHVRLLACHVLEIFARSRVACPGAADHLVWVLRTEGNEAVRAQAAAALGYTGNRRAVQALLKAFDADPDLSVRIEAAAALGRLGFSEAAAPLAQWLVRGERKPGERKLELALEVEYALERIGGGRALEALVKYLGEDLFGPKPSVAEKAHRRLVEVTGRNPIERQSVSSLSKKEREQLRLGWQRTASEWKLLGGLREAVAGGDAAAVAGARGLLEKGYRLEGVKVPEGNQAAVLAFFEDLGELWLALERMNVALVAGSLWEARTLRDELHDRFGIDDGYFPTANARELREVWKKWKAWAENVDPF
jgi:HEAT repeat protein